MVQQIAEINKSGKRSGWFKPTEQPPIVPENQEEEKMERGMGDFLLSPSKAKATWQNQTESGSRGLLLSSRQGIFRYLHMTTYPPSGS